MPIAYLSLDFVCIFGSNLLFTGSWNQNIAFTSQQIFISNLERKKNTHSEHKIMMLFLMDVNKERWWIFHFILKFFTDEK